MFCLNCFLDFLIFTFALKLKCAPQCIYFLTTDLFQPGSFRHYHFFSPILITLLLYFANTSSYLLSDHSSMPRTPRYSSFSPLWFFKIGIRLNATNMPMITFVWFFLTEWSRYILDINACVNEICTKPP